VSSGALATLSGAKTGRSPKDKRIVREPDSESDIWWRTPDNGSPNYEMDEQCAASSLLPSLHPRCSSPSSFWGGESWGASSMTGTMN
jgi:Phosphoenolpyruvate carboxykinase